MTNLTAKTAWTRTSDGWILYHGVVEAKLDDGTVVWTKTVDIDRLSEAAALKDAEIERDHLGFSSMTVS